MDYACTAVGLRLTYCSSMPCTVGTTNRRTSGGKLALRACEGLGYIGPGIIAPVAELAHESKDRAPPFPFWYLNLLRPGIQTSPGHSKCKYSHLTSAAHATSRYWNHPDQAWTLTANELPPRDHRGRTSTERLPTHARKASIGDKRYRSIQIDALISNIDGAAASGTLSPLLCSADRLCCFGHANSGLLHCS